jgi:hypothetical protein
MKKIILGVVVSIVGFLMSCEEVTTMPCIQKNIVVAQGENVLLHGLNNLKNSNYCHYNGLVASSWTFDGIQAPTRTLVRFDLADSLRNRTIVSAKLVLKGYINSSNANVINHPQNNNTIDIIRVPNDWTCSTVTWNNQPTIGSNFVTLPNIGVLTGTNDNQSVDVTPLVQEMLNNGNFGFLLKAKDEESTYRARWFGSFTSPSGFKPTLEITLQ